MKTSETTGEIAKALASFQRSVGKIKKDSSNPFFKSKYASLSQILDSIAEPLADNGLSFVQAPTANNGLTTRILHQSGEWLEDTYTVNPVKNDPQALGSAITYARRYALAAFLGLNIDEDDDGNSASANATSRQVSKPDVQPVSQPTIQPVIDPGVVSTVDAEHKEYINRITVICKRGKEQGIIPENVLASIREKMPEVKKDIFFANDTLVKLEEAFPQLT